jgi:SAM-dependent methyltransferase
MRSLKARESMVEQSVEFVRACYDAVASEYADRFAGELAHKPLDRLLLTRFASEVDGRGEVCDVGCGPGQTTAYLHSHGVQVCGLDLSPQLLREATQRHPDVRFETGDMLALPRADGTVAGLVAFYAIVHFSSTQLSRAVQEMHRVLQPGGRLLLAFHIGDGTVHVEGFLGRPVSLDFSFFRPASLADELVTVGFVGVELIERDPYPDVEHPSLRAYVFAQKPVGGLEVGPDAVTDSSSG